MRVVLLFTQKEEQHEGGKCHAGLLNMQGRREKVLPLPGVVSHAAAVRGENNPSGIVLYKHEYLSNI